ncbi:unnamed protein product [Allacma fusca]|uniref:Uncharacterized protein n=1 Tax=Allacma fusca TaxID=39272 RepID=A0A8J2JRC8_9HEXA|nr:unnamed protein product [Allacma fusca]
MVVTVNGNREFQAWCQRDSPSLLIGKEVQQGASYCEAPQIFVHTHEVMSEERNSTEQQIVEVGNSTALVDSEKEIRSEMGSDTDLTFSNVAIIIPAVVFGLLIVIVIIYYLWMCWEEYVTNKEEEKAAAVEASKHVAVPIAEPEDFSPIVPVDGADNDDGTDGDIEDAT